MTRNLRFILFFPLAIIIACAAGPFITFAGPPKEARTVTSCVEQIRVARATSPFKSWDSRDTQAKRELVRAVVLKDGGYEAAPALARYAASGQILMGVDRKTREPVLSSQYFSPLARVDATRIEPGQRKEIGTFLAVSSGSPAFRDVVLFLLESQVVTTYWHVESMLCLVSEDDSTDLYRAHFEGKHIYYTNRYNEEKLDFWLSIEKKTGCMFLLGGG